MIYEIVFQMSLQKVATSCFQNALKNDRIDFFFLGDFNEVEITESLKSLPFTARENDVTIQYHQSYSNVLREGMIQRNVGQSILELGLSFSYKIWR